MGEREPKEASVGDGIPRLPPGRHGLGRDFVARNQRDRLTAGIIATVGERGYGPATIAQISSAAGVSRRTFYAYFAAKEDCYLDALDRLLDYLTVALREAAAEAADWPSAVRAKVQTMLSIFAANPDLLRFGWIAPLRAGHVLRLVYHRNVEYIVDLLCEGRPAATSREPSPVVQQAVAGGMMSTIATRVESDDPASLEDLLPDLVEFFLAQYLGQESAVAAIGDLIDG